MDLTQLTAQFMSNRKFMDKLDIPEITNNHKTFVKESNFYKERIIELTESLLNNREEVEPHLTKEVLISFNTFVRACICFFKTKDLNDIYQKEHYSHPHSNPYMSTKEEKTEQELEQEAMQELDNLFGEEEVPFHCADEIIMRQIKIKNNLDKFLKYNKKEAQIILPKQKEIDLEHPDLKKKPFFPPPPPPPPPLPLPLPPQEEEEPPTLTPYPPVSPSHSNQNQNQNPTSESESAIEEIKDITKSLVEEVILEVVDKIEKGKKTSPKKKKKKPSKKVETIHLDL